MARLIDADKLLQLLPDGFSRGPYYLSATSVRRQIQQQPTVDAAPVVHGKWVEYKPENNDYGMLPAASYYCSECRNNSAFTVDGMEPMPTKAFGRLIYKYCPHCGAKMDLEETP
jgi:hypothetical protein